MARIHPLACVDASATLADDCDVGPFCVVGPHVTLSTGCRLVSQVNVQGHTEIGERTVVHPFASLGTAPQSKGYRGEPTRLAIGADCEIRESVTMNIGTMQGGGLTKVGAGCMFMAYTHVGHDCRVGDRVVLANLATLAGHCVVGDDVFMGGLSTIHQFGRIGTGAMVGGMTGLRGDVIPHGLAAGPIGRLRGLNVIGLKRRGVTREAVAAARRAYRELFLSQAPLTEQIEPVAARYGDNPVVADIVAFLRADTARPLCRPGGTAPKE